jgi:hypothetical protein
MDFRCYLVKKIVQCDPSIAAVGFPAFSQSREYEQRPSSRLEEVGFHLVSRDLRWRVVPIPAVVFDRQFDLGKREVDVVFIHSIERDRRQATRTQCVKDASLVIAHLGRPLLPLRSLAQIVVTSLPSPDRLMTGCRHCRPLLRRHLGVTRAFIFGRRTLRDAVRSQQSPNGTVANSKLTSNRADRRAFLCIKAGQDCGGDDRAPLADSVTSIRAGARAIQDRALTRLLHYLYGLPASLAVDRDVRHFSGPLSPRIIPSLNCIMAVLPSVELGA